MVMPKKEEEHQALCSACYQSVPLPKTHVIPHFNDHLNAYVTTYRCDNCWLTTIDATRLRLSMCQDPDEVATCAEFFERYKVKVMEHRRGDPLEAVKAKLLQLLDEIRAGTRRLDIGKPVKIDLDKLKGLFGGDLK
jgi:hypothetical protein